MGGWKERKSAKGKKKSAKRNRKKRRGRNE
jgi:hypothetical protein